MTQNLISRNEPIDPRGPGPGVGTVYCVYTRPLVVVACVPVGDFIASGGRNGNESFKPAGGWDLKLRPATDDQCLTYLSRQGRGRKELTQGRDSHRLADVLGRLIARKEVPNRQRLARLQARAERTPFPGSVRHK